MKDKADDMKNDDDSGHHDSPKPSFWHIVLSTMAAAFGVQSRSNQERDFKHGNIYTYIVAGLIFTVLFIIIVSTIVKVVLNNSGL